MKGIEFKQIRSAIMLFIISIIVSAAVVIFMNQHHTEVDQETSRLKGEKSILMQEKMEYSEHLRIYREYARDYAQLQSLGAFDLDARLNWMEEIEHAVQTLAIPMTNYEIGVRERSEKPANNSSPLGLYQTRIKITFELLHEGDLLKVLDYLSSANLGLHEVDECEITREENSSENEVKKQLNAECTLTSYSFVFDDTSSDDTMPPMI